MPFGIGKVLSTRENNKDQFQFDETKIKPPINRRLKANTVVLTKECDCMKKQLRGIALILFGILLAIIGIVDELFSAGNYYMQIKKIYCRASQNPQGVSRKTNTDFASCKAF